MIGHVDQTGTSLGAGRVTGSFEQFTTSCDDVTETEWNALLDGFADGSVYQTWAYGAVRWGEKHLSHFVLRRNGVPVAAAQLRIVRVPVLGMGIAYIRWGPVWLRKSSPSDPAVWEAAVSALVEEYVHRRGLVLRVIPFMFQEDALGGALSAGLTGLGLTADGAARPYETFRLELRPSLEILRSRFAHKWRNQLNAAERNRLEVREARDAGLDAEFVGMYREMVARKGFKTRVSVTEFQQIQDRLPTSQKMLVLVASRDGRPVSGLVASTVGTTGVYLLGATADDGLKAKGSYLLQWELLRRLKERGSEFYDLGGIDREGNPGVYDFKKGLGGDHVVQLPRHGLPPSRFGQFAVAGVEQMSLRLGRMAARLRT